MPDGVKFSEEEDKLMDNSILHSLRTSHTSESDEADGSDIPPTSASRSSVQSRTEIERLHYRMINERVVEDVTLEFFYKPHTVTVLVVICAFLLLPAFMRDDRRSESNAFVGLIAVAAFFLVVSALTFPNGPFIRPHPVFWRIIFGLSVLYVMILQFALFQSFGDIKRALKWLDPEGLSKERLDEKAYAVNCSDVTLERIWSHMDIFAVGHFCGWAMKALLIRHYIICWYISIAWEVTEYFFAHLLPNFEECWWDAIVLDVIVCNGLGIWFGNWVAGVLEMRQFHWESIKNIKSKRGKLKRAVLQFTPESWMKVNWYNNFALRRTLSIYAFVMIWLVTELNTFFLKHIFAVDTSHPLVFWRIILIGFMSAPSIRQFYVFATDPRVKRMGMQSWIYLAVCALEGAICIKFGRPQLPHVKFRSISAWILFMAIGTFFCVWFSVWCASKSTMTKEKKINGKVTRYYLDSSHENLGVLAADVSARRKLLNIAGSE